MLKALEALFDNPLFKTNVKFGSRKYRPNDVVVAEGKIHNFIYLIKSGSVKVQVSGTTDAKKAIRPGVANLGPDEMIGELGLFDNLPASADVVAAQESEIIEIDIPSFLKFLENNPQLGYKVLYEMTQVITKRLRHANETIIRLLAAQAGRLL